MCWASQVVLVVRNPPANAGDVRDVGSIPGSGRSPGGCHDTYSSILAWRIPWTEEPNGLQSIRSQRVRHNWATNTHAPVCMLSHFSRVGLFMIPLTVAHQAPLSTGFSRQEYWSWSPFPSPGTLLDPGIEPRSPALAGGFFTIELFPTPGEAHQGLCCC